MIAGLAITTLLAAMARQKATEDGTVKLYHWAPKSARASIEQHGLDHRRAPQPLSEPSGVFFNLTLEDALDMGSGEVQRTHDLYEVKVPPQILFRPDPYQLEDAVFTTQAILPSALQRLKL